MKSTNDDKPSDPTISEYKERALAIISIYADIGKITEREYNILREAILN